MAKQFHWSVPMNLYNCLILEKVIGNKLKREIVDGFEPIHDVPESKAAMKGSYAAKPKRPVPYKQQANEKSKQYKKDSTKFRAKLETEARNKQQPKKPKTRPFITCGCERQMGQPFSSRKPGST